MIISRSACSVNCSGTSNRHGLPCCCNSPISRMIVGKRRCGRAVSTRTLWHAQSSFCFVCSPYDMISQNKGIWGVTSVADTIAAIATALGEGGISIIRISGEKAIEHISQPCFTRRNKAAALPRSPFDARHNPGQIETDEPLDEAMGVVMRAPHSYTKEDVCELAHPWRVRRRSPLQCGCLRTLAPVPRRPGSLRAGHS